MRIDKREAYAETMTLNGIDTLSGYVPGKVESTKEAKENIKQCNYQTNRERTYLLINPNKQPEKKEKLITKYSDFVRKMSEILDTVGVDLDDYDVIRCDFCFNSRDEQSYEEYQKLHRLLLSCLAKAYAFKNCYVSQNLWDYGKLSIAIKKDDSEAENYNKKRESEGKDESANRLELRSKRMSGTTIEYQFMTKWFERLEKARKQFKNVQMESNYHLERLYKKDLSKPKKERDYISLNAFLMQYREAIYCRGQMIDLLSRFDEVKNPKKKADRFKEKHKIEYFSQADLNKIIDVLREKTEEYFNS